MQNAIIIFQIIFSDITYASIAAECWFFFFAGFEASALVVSMTLFELARNPDIQNKLRNEVDKVLKNSNGEITFDALQEMTYMEMVVYGKCGQGSRIIINEFLTWRNPQKN